MGTTRGGPCSVIMGRSNYVRDPKVTLEILSGLSSDVTINTHTDPHGKPYTYFSPVSKRMEAEYDFTAHTYGAQTSCSLISKPCGLHYEAAWVEYNCSAILQGGISDATLNETFFKDKSMQYAIGPASMADTGTDNPYYFALVSGDGQNAEGTLMSGRLSNPDFVVSMHGLITYVLRCKSTIYDIHYDQVNGSTTRFDAQLSNTSVSNIWQITTSTYAAYWSPSVKQAATAAMATANSSQEFEDIIALSYSKASMAMGAQGIESRPTLALQRRATTLVAKDACAQIHHLEMNANK